MKLVRFDSEAACLPALLEAAACRAGHCSGSEVEARCCSAQAFGMNFYKSSPFFKLEIQGHLVLIVF